MNNHTSKLMGLGLLAVLTTSTGCDFETVQALVGPDRAASIFIADPDSSKPIYRFGTVLSSNPATHPSVGLSSEFTQASAAAKSHLRFSTAFTTAKSAGKPKYRITTALIADPAGERQNVRTPRVR